MRAAAALVGLAVLSGCATLPSVDRTQPALALAEEGLRPAGSDLRIDFGRAQDGVIRAVTSLQGKGPDETVALQDCGAGPVLVARWDTGLSLNFQDGRFLGWVVQDPFQGTYPAEAAPLGTPLSAVTGARVEETSLGREFLAGGLWHLSAEDSGHVTTVWSGLTCFFR